MTYLIKHPINMYTPKFAMASYSTSYTIAAGLPRTHTMQLDTIAQSAGMGLSLSSNQIVLKNKKYAVYFKMGLQDAVEGRGGNLEIRLNGSAISETDSVKAETTASSSPTASGIVTPINIAFAMVDAQDGDLLSFFYTRTTGSSVADTVYIDSNRAILIEIGDNV